MIHTRAPNDAIAGDKQTSKASPKRGNATLIRGQRNRPLSQVWFLPLVHFANMARSVEPNFTTIILAIKFVRMAASELTLRSCCARGALLAGTVYAPSGLNFNLAVGLRARFL